MNGQFDGAIELNAAGFHSTIESAKAFCEWANLQETTFNKLQVVERTKTGDYTLWAVCSKLPSTYRAV